MMKKSGFSMLGGVDKLHKDKLESVDVFRTMYDSSIANANIVEVRLGNIIHSKNFKKRGFILLLEVDKLLYLV